MSKTTKPKNLNLSLDTFTRRHVGPSAQQVTEMLASLSMTSLEELVSKTVPAGIRQQGPLDLGPTRGEQEVINDLRKVANKNQLWKNHLGQGYYDCITPPVIQRNILENPGWYTQYTPYQAEISQGRLEALLNYQTMVTDLTGLEIANSSMLDEATAAAEAMTMVKRVNRTQKSNRFLISAGCHPQTIDVVKGRAEPMGYDVEVVQDDAFDFSTGAFGILVQYPTTTGSIEDYRALTKAAHDNNALVIVACDLLALTALTPPGEWDADVAIGNSQRFGVSLGYGGPHAAFFATRIDYQRQMPGRIVGVSKDMQEESAYRLALQTREQHIRREKATSNICTAQVLLAIMAGMYGVYHGPRGIQAIAQKLQGLTCTFANGIRKLGHTLAHEQYFDTVCVQVKADELRAIRQSAQKERTNLRFINDTTVCVSFGETTTPQDINRLLKLFNLTDSKSPTCEMMSQDLSSTIPEALSRQSDFMTNQVFHRYHSETEFLRYVHRLQSKDLSLTTSMIPLGSCTMKLNGTTEMVPVTWPEFANIHPCAPADQAQGYLELIASLEKQLAAITGFSRVSFQPNAGSQGEYAGLLTIRAFHRKNNEAHRNICLIPSSAHGTNPASAAMAGMKVVIIKCDPDGNIDLEDLKQKIEKHKDQLSAIMVTYPSTHGVFEEGIQTICKLVHDGGGLVYLDGANLNAQVGLCRPGDYGADVCHLNLHKTFCIPHGGGGPGMGPIAVTAQLAPFLPGHPVLDDDAPDAIAPVSAMPFGSPSILPISWAYIEMLGAEGLKEATSVAILNANYMANRLSSHFPILYRGNNDCVAHEFILNCKQFKETSGVEVEDIAKRLIDYGFHAPTMSWPVAGTLMVEPTESESQEELDRLCDALISIRAEIARIESGEWPRDNNPLKHAPHTAKVLAQENWDHPYSRETAVYPGPWTRNHKFWPPVGRVDNVYGDRNLFCSCPTIEDFES
jgi:glycine dehydrogenase